MKMHSVPPSNLPPAEPVPVLVVEDDDDIRDLVRAQLQEHGYRVFEAADGRSALDLLTSEDAPEPRVIVLDMNMPVMSGWEVLAALRASARLGRIPVVIASAVEPRLGEGHDAVKAVLRKPFDLDELAAKVSAYARDACAA